MVATSDDQEANPDVLAATNNTANHYTTDEDQMKEDLAAGGSFESCRWIHHLCEYPEEHKLSFMSS